MSRRARNLRWAIFLAPVALFALFLGIKIQAPGLYVWLIREDGWLENLQFILFLAAGVMAVATGRRLRRNRLAPHWFLFILLGAGLLVVAMDEISWGQRLFGIETPDQIAAINWQSEITLHNLDPFIASLHTAYLVVGAYGTLGWLGMLFNPPPRSIRRFVLPAWYQSTWFAFVLVVYGAIELARHVQPTIFGREFVIGSFVGFRDQEPAELVLAAGFLIFVVSCFRRAGSDPVRLQT